MKMPGALRYPEQDSHIVGLEVCLILDNEGEIVIALDENGGSAEGTVLAPRHDLRQTVQTHSLSRASPAVYACAKAS